MKRSPSTCSSTPWFRCSILPDFASRFVFVNDGSRDETLAHLLDCSERDKRVRVVNLSRNFGKEAAMTAGIENARGDVLIPMDIDLQDPPEVIAPFMERWREGYDVVYGVRAARPTDT